MNFEFIDRIKKDKKFRNNVLLIVGAIMFISYYADNHLFAVGTPQNSPSYAGRTLAECQAIQNQMGTHPSEEDISQCIIEGCVFYRTSLGVRYACVNCLGEGQRMDIDKPTFMTYAWIEDNPLVYPSKICCPGLEAKKYTANIDEWECVDKNRPPEVGGSCGDGISDEIANLVRDLAGGKVTCGSAKIIGFGAMFMLGMIAISFI